ncbi:MAG TPA: sensor domain-containing phosphodiesterase [Acidimicrobiales bacterium]|nr:sensor domain-containing phosphodiesterase [Acidimicrobiales bacterium]
MEQEDRAGTTRSWHAGPAETASRPVGLAGQPPVLGDEHARLAEIDHYQLGDPAWSPVLADIVRLAAHLMRARHAAIDVVGDACVWSLAAFGGAVADRPRASCSSALVVSRGDAVVVRATRGTHAAPNAPLRPRAQLAPGVAVTVSRPPEPAIRRRYVGVPLVSPAGLVVGALCAWGGGDGPVTVAEMADMRALASQARRLLELHHERWTLDRDRARHVLQSRLLLDVVAGRPLDDVLATLVTAVEAQAPGLICSVMLVEDGRLRGAAAPSVPKAFRDAIEGVEIGPDVGSCGHAAATGEAAYAGDIGTDPRWAPFRETALANGLRACWSVPVVGAGGEVVATFGGYYATPRLPGDEHVRLMADWAALAGIAIVRSREQDELRRAARSDPLTGLANRQAILQAIDNAIVLGTKRLAAVLVCDLDGFKVLNDSLGHAHGDTFLVDLARRLVGELPEELVVGRLGGDEFVVVANVRGGDAAARLAERVLAIVRQPVCVGGRAVVLSASVGVALGRGPDAAHDLLKDADAAMYAAKSTGRNRFAMSDRGLRAAATARLELELELRSAIAHGDITCDYQAKVDLRTGDLVGIEALARWRRPCGGAVGPDVFIPIAEQSGSIVELGAAVLARACKEHAARRTVDPSYRDVRLWVNVSVKQLAGGLVSTVDELLAVTGVPGDRLGLEITESALVSDVVLATTVLAELRARGVSVAIDDFGQGYSSLAQLRRLPVDVLKIDKAFVEGIGVDAADERIATAIIGLGRALEIDVVAEGIETELQRRRLLELGCELGQGYLLGVPGPLERAVNARVLTRRTGGVRRPGAPRAARTPAVAPRRASPGRPEGS